MSSIKINRDSLFLNSFKRVLGKMQIALFHDVVLHVLFSDALLRSTRTGKKSSNEYWKRGSYKDALKDFKKLKPTNISRTQVCSF